MKEILEKIGKLKSTIKNMEDENNKLIFQLIAETIEQLTDKVEEVIVKQETLDENIGYIGEDLTDIQEELFEEVSFDELADIEDEYVEINCKECSKPLFVEKDALDNKKIIPCPFCNKQAT